MKKSVLSLLVFIAGTSGLFSQYNSGEEILRVMHKRYAKGPCRSYSFSQRNIHYKADTVAGSSVWHENIEFPDKFRIVFGKPEHGNKVVFRNDSSYHYRKNELLEARAYSNTLLLLLGGMYYRNFDDVKQRLKQAGYSLQAWNATHWSREEVLVAGAVAGDTLSNQIWVSRKDLRIVRILEKMSDGRIMDMRFESHQKWCGGLVETKVSFRRDGRLEQVEEYYNMKETTSFPE